MFCPCLFGVLMLLVVLSISCQHHYLVLYIWLHLTEICPMHDNEQFKVPCFNSGCTNSQNNNQTYKCAAHHFPSIINQHYTYHIAQASQATHGSLVDRGADGGLGGSDVRFLFRSCRSFSLPGIVCLIVV